MAKPEQLRMIEGLWNDVSKGTTVEEIKNGLRKFLENRFKVSDMRFLTGQQVTAVTAAQRRMKTNLIKDEKQAAR